MYKGYKLEEVNISNFSYYHKIGNSLYLEHKRNVRTSLETFLHQNNTLDGTEIIQNWFPEIEADIFLSHSHNDECNVIALAGWLYETFSLTSFIDSCVWGYGNDLIKNIDDQYSRYSSNPSLYDYSKVLLSTSHVHMMLSTSLASMIDKTECIIFYNTPNSIKKFNGEERTESPWIYSEIAFAEIVREIKPERLTQLNEGDKTFSTEGRLGVPNISYKVDTNHLQKINDKTLNKWKNEYTKYSSMHPLDKLYELTKQSKR